MSQLLIYQRVRLCANLFGSDLAWEGLFHWLIEHYPAHFYAICEAEESIRTLERQGITAGMEYEAACQELLERFEVVRRLKLRQGFKIWMQ